MPFLWSIVLLVSLIFAIAGPLFFGHGLVEGETTWYGAAAVCVLIAAVLFLVQKRFRPDGHHHS